MRVIGGSAKGRKFTVPKGFDSSPTTDYAKEGLFNILEHKFNLYGVKVLDLCCGTGSMSYEFASRGAIEVLALDKNPKCIKYVKENTELFRLDQIAARRMDVNAYLRNTNHTWDIIVADPPFDADVLKKWVAKIFEKNMINPGGMLILEHDEHKTFSSHERFHESRKYGHVHFSFFTLD